jgi:hypothetical protein
MKTVYETQWNFGAVQGADIRTLPDAYIRNTLDILKPSSYRARLLRDEVKRRRLVKKCFAEYEGYEPTPRPEKK